MNVKRKIVHTFILCILMISMAFSLSYGMITSIKLTPSPIKVLGCVIMCGLLLVGIFYNKRVAQIIFIGIALSTGIGTLYLMKKDLLTVWRIRFYQDIQFFCVWLEKFIRGQGLEEIGYRMLLALMICIVIVGIVYCFTIRRFNFLCLAIMGSSFFIAQVIKKMPINSLAFNGFIVACLFYYFEHYYLKLQSKREETEYINQKHYVKSVVPLIGIVFCLTFACANLTPIKLTFFHGLLDVKRSAGSYDHMAYFPYEGTLGGDIELEKTPLLQVKAPRCTYLKTATKAIYTGSSWTNIKQEPVLTNVTDRAYDTFEMLWASRLLTDIATNDLFYKDTLEITFQKLYTKSLFIPAKKDQIVWHQKIGYVYLKNEETFYLDKPKGEGFTYEVVCYTPKYQSKVLEEVLRKSESGLYERYKQLYALRNKPLTTQTKETLKLIEELKAIEEENTVLLNATVDAKKETTDETIDELIRRAKKIKETYTSLPEDMPQRVKDLAVTITKDCKTDYDKAKAIEAYLASHYTYTLTPGMPRENQDFVDQFLFENKEGYCTYFATAMAVLTRCIGLPSKYVQGYSMPSTADLETGVYEVTSKEAHAWVEVYFEGFGWMLFEPTASYQGAFRGEQAKTMQEGGPKPLEAPVGLEREALSTTEEGSQRNKLGSIILSVGLIGMGIGLAFIAHAQCKNYQFKKMGPRNRVLYRYAYYLKKLSKKNIIIEPGETPSIYAKRVDGLLGLEPTSFEEITTVFLIAKYSDLEVTETQMEKTESFCKIFCKQLKKYR